MTADAETNRTVVLGFDALDFRYLDRFADSLPNFERLRDAGVESPLESTVPPWTGSAWPSMYTGMDPSHHGVFGFFRHDGYPDEGEVVSRADVDAPALWNYLSNDGLPSVVCNVPVTHPADPIEGTLLPGYLASEDAPGHPEGVREELSAALEEEYRVYSRAEMASDPEEKLAGYLELLDLRRRTARELLEGEDWRLAVLQVQKTDAVFHNFEDADAWRAVYEAADEIVGTVLDVVGEETNVIVCSDHGIGPVRGYQIHVNEVLREHGYVEAASEGDHLSLPAEKGSLVGSDGPAGDGDRPSQEDDGGALFHRLVEGLDRVGITPGRVYAAAERLGVEETLVSLTPTSVGAVVAETVDWRTSRAYCRRSVRLGVRINLAGREPEGTVAPEAYESVRAELIDLLSALETPDGEPAFETVAPREAYFDGPYADRAPDVVTVPREMDNGLSTRLYGRPFVPVDTRDHKRHGVFLGAGPGFAADAVADLLLPDVAPIVMALLGRPVPVRMTGRVPEGLLSAPVERTSYGDVPYGRSGAAREGEGEADAGDDAVTERLEDLGYL